MVTLSKILDSSPGLILTSGEIRQKKVFKIFQAARLGEFTAKATGKET